MEMIDNLSSESIKAQLNDLEADIETLVASRKAIFSEILDCEESLIITKVLELRAIITTLNPMEAQRNELHKVLRSTSHSELLAGKKIAPVSLRHAADLERQERDKIAKQEKEQARQVAQQAAIEKANAEKKARKGARLQKRKEAIEAKETREKELKEARIAAENAKKSAFELERLAFEGRRKQIIQNAISTGDLMPVQETSVQIEVNRQKQSNGGVIRIESGAR